MFLRAECPASFTHISSMNGCYKVVPHNLNWTAAGRECRRLHRDAHLVVINDAAEQTAVAATLASTSREYTFHIRSVSGLLASNSEMSGVEKVAFKLSQLQVTF